MKRAENRKCAYCGEMIVVNREVIQDLVLYENRYFHKEHFLQMCQEKILSPRTQKKKWQDAKNDVDKYVRDACIKITDFLDKDDLYQYILENYDITVVPSTIFHKLTAIYDGSYKGMSGGIPVPDLLDMWKRKQNFLNGIHAKRKSKDKQLDAAAMINYDLSVLVNKYDGYLKWKENQVVLENEPATHKDIILKDFNLQELGRRKSLLTEKGDDMDELLTEIFD